MIRCKFHGKNQWIFSQHLGLTLQAYGALMGYHHLGRALNAGTHQERMTLARC